MTEEHNAGVDDQSNKEMEMLKKSETEILKMKSSIRSDKNSFEKQ